jgi:hypothetical protein
MRALGFGFVSVHSLPCSKPIPPTLSNEIVCSVFCADEQYLLIVCERSVVFCGSRHGAKWDMVLQEQSTLDALAAMNDPKIQQESVVNTSAGCMGNDAFLVGVSLFREKKVRKFFFFEFIFPLFAIEINSVSFFPFSFLNATKSWIAFFFVFSITSELL